MMTPNLPLPIALQKPDAVNVLAQALNLRVNAWISAEAGQVIEKYLQENRAFCNDHIEVSSNDSLVAEAVVHLSSFHARKTPVALNNPPPFFSADSTIVQFPVPAAEILTLPMAFVACIQDAPTIFNNKFQLVEKYSSSYSKLLYFYDYDINWNREPCRFIDGRLLVIIDDIGGLNYCHWLADWLSRLALVEGATQDLYVAVLPLQAEYQRESLKIIGALMPDRIVEIKPWECVQAREVLAPANLSRIHHPAYSGSPWALSFLRNRCSISDEPGRRRLYISRRDAAQRRILNEDRLLPLLEKNGYDVVIMSGMPFIEQVRLFSSASHIVGLHGAGLANVIFAPRSSRILEIFPCTYGTPAFWILAAAAGVQYYCYTAERVKSGSITQGDDIELDIDDFVRSCADTFFEPSLEADRDMAPP